VLVESGSGAAGLSEAAWEAESGVGAVSSSVSTESIALSGTGMAMGLGLVGSMIPAALSASI